MKGKGGGGMKPKPSSCFNKEIRKLECSINYNRSPSVARGK